METKRLISVKLHRTQPAKNSTEKLKLSRNEDLHTTMTKDARQRAQIQLFLERKDEEGADRVTKNSEFEYSLGWAMNEDYEITVPNEIG